MTGHKPSPARREQIAAQACTGKHRFESFEAARAGVRPHMGNRVEPYRCPVCTGWHVGTSDIRRREQKKRFKREARP